MNIKRMSVRMLECAPLMIALVVLVEPFWVAAVVFMSASLIGVWSGDIQDAPPGGNMIEDEKVVASDPRFPYGGMSDQTERVLMVHTCSGNGCGEPVGSSRLQQAWVHEDGSHLCGGGLGVLEREDFEVDVPVPEQVLRWEANHAE